MQGQPYLIKELKRDLREFDKAMKQKKYDVAYHHLNGVKEICDYILPNLKSPIYPKVKK